SCALLIPPWSLLFILRFRLWVYRSRHSRLVFGCHALVIPVLLLEVGRISLVAAGTLEMILVDGGILTGVVVAFILSLRMMFTAKTKNSLQFQLAVWLVICTVSEIWRYLQTIGTVNFSQPVLFLGMG